MEQEAPSQSCSLTDILGQVITTFNSPPPVLPTATGIKGITI